MKPRLYGDKDRLIPQEDVERILAFLDAAVAGDGPTPAYLVRKRVAPGPRSRRRRGRAPKDDHTWFWRQSRLAVRLLLQSGLRCAELARLRVGDCELDTRPHRLLVRGGKKRHADEVDPVTIPPDLAEELEAWIAEHELEAGDPILFRASGVGYSRRWIYELAKEPVRQLRLNPKFATHHYRHRYATSLLTGTDDLLMVQKQLRHRSLQPTSTYLHLAASEEQMDAAMDAVSLGGSRSENRPRRSSDAARRRARLAQQLEQGQRGKKRKTTEPKDRDPGDQEPQA